MELFLNLLLNQSFSLTEALFSKTVYLQPILGFPYDRATTKNTAGAFPLPLKILALQLK
jgi:hypothetical protein